MANLCKSCSGPLDDFNPKDIKNPDFCPMCVNERGNLKSYGEILEGMIDYIKNDHPEIEPSKRQEQANKWLSEGPVWGTEFRGRLAKEGLTNLSVLDEVEILGDNDEVSFRFFRPKLEKVLANLKINLKEKFWAKLVADEEMYVIFKDRIFDGKPNDTRFKKVVNDYALDAGCSEDLLPFSDTGAHGNRQYKAATQFT